jgi:hypothetical protein
VTFAGGCLCGAIRYRFTNTPRALTLCHCRSCRLSAGAPAVAWLVLGSDDFTFTAGRPKVFRSSPGVLRSFCDRCGTSLTYQREGQTDTIDVTSATLDAPDAFAPTKEIWLEHKLRWMQANEALPHYAQTSRGTAPMQRTPGT